MTAPTTALMTEHLCLRALLTLCLVILRPGNDVRSDEAIDVRRPSVRRIVPPIVPKKAVPKKIAAVGRPKLSLAIKPILGGGILLVASVAAYFALSYFNLTHVSLGLSAARAPHPEPDRRSGSIIILSGDPRACRRLKFDNVTGAMKDEGMGPCADIGPGVAERLGQVSDSFQQGR